MLCYSNSKIDFESKEVSLVFNTHWHQILEFPGEYKLQLRIW